ncbi:MAG: SWIM zinc finger family protein [Chloroflexi bacterium OHK40]
MPRYNNSWRRERRERRGRLPAEGIRAESQHGSFGESWWAQRWVAALERLGYGSRLARGRTYARGGAVLSLDLGRGTVSARVQGSRPTPYRVTMEIAQLSDRQWEQAIDAMAEQAIFAAKLLAGEMPREIEQAFTTAGVSLFPQTARELKTNCTCPDSANPCKHIAAVYYLLGERFDKDPFLLFALRGRDRDQVIEALRGRRADAAGDEVEAPPVEQPPGLAEQLEHFDEPGPGLAEIAPQIAAPPVASALLRRYGPPPGDISSELHVAYVALTRATLKRLFGDE